MQLPVHWMATLFEALLHLEMRQGELALAPLNELRRLLPNSAFLMANTALAHYMNVCFIHSGVYPAYNLAAEFC